jgi:large subunit ribosomal protein L6
MSRIGLKEIVIPSGVKVELQGSKLKVTGPKGTLDINVPSFLKVNIDTAAGKLNIVSQDIKNKNFRTMHGTTRALIANMVKGVHVGFEKKLEIYGTGYNVKEQGGNIVLQVGYCKPAEIPIPKNVKLTIEIPATKGNEVPAKFGVSGPDKCILGQFASEIRNVQKPDPYKGKGIRFAGERIKKKVGKAFASGSA